MSNRNNTPRVTKITFGEFEITFGVFEITFGVFEITFEVFEITFGEIFLCILLKKSFK